jgi:hypothetical protein
MTETFKINDIEYECEFKLSNPDNQEITFTKSAIRGMKLIDNVFEPFLNGTVDIANPYDYIEDTYFLRGDGRDRFSIMFKPKDGEGKVEHAFMICDDANSGNPMVRSENIKTFALIDENAIPFMDKIPYGKVYSGKIGKIIQDIFIELLGEDKVDKDKWEEGDFNIEYIPPATFRYMDVLRYLLRLFYAKDDDIYVKALMSHDGGTNKFNFQLMSKIYNDNDKNTIEAFSLGDLTSEIDTNNDNNPFSGPPVGEFIGGLKNLGYSTPLYNWTNDYFINSLVIGYDKILGVQKIKKIKFEDIRKKWQTKFVDVFKCLNGKPKPFTIKNDTTSEKFKRYKFPYSAEDGVKIVEAEIHNNLTFYNLQVSFSNVGDTKRESGKFVDIFTTRGDTKLKSDEKLLGRWYLTEIHHIFFADLYTNQIFCTKTYVGPKSNFKEDVE